MGVRYTERFYKGLVWLYLGGTNNFYQFASLDTICGYVYHFEFWTPSLPNGVHNNRPCPSVSPSLNISRDGSLVFPETLHEVAGQ